MKYRCFEIETAVVFGIWHARLSCRWFARCIGGYRSEDEAMVGGMVLADAQLEYEAGLALKKLRDTNIITVGKG